MDVMTEIFGVLGDPRKWSKKPIRVKTTDEIRAEQEEYRKYEREVEQLIDEAKQGRAAKHLAGERQANEAKIASYVDQMLADELIMIVEKRMPSETVRQKYIETFKDFATWCRSQGVEALPAAGPVIFLWLVQDRRPELVAQRARALRFVFEVSRAFLDEPYIAAAERWARLKSKTKKENESDKESSS